MKSNAPEVLCPLLLLIGKWEVSVVLSFLHPLASWASSNLEMDKPQLQ